MVIFDGKLLNEMTVETKENYFSRAIFIRRLQNPAVVWDLIVIGGGATGLGVAIDAASRGYKTLLVEQADFSSGTSSRSTKLVHGGVRYLAQGNLRLVHEALYERGLMLKNAPHLVKQKGFVIPAFHWWEKYFYGAGLKIYDWMARKLRLGKTRYLSAADVKSLLPNVREKSLVGGILYYDGQFDDARLAVNMAQTAAEQGATLVNYMKVTELLHGSEGQIEGVTVQDQLSGQQERLRSKVVVNAAGVFVDDILTMHRPTKPPMIKVSQGIHLVLDKSFLPTNYALMIPATSDGRVLFAIPWQDHLLVGTTDTPVDSHSLEPVALEEEINFILDTLKDYLERKPSREDVLSVFAGLRPLVQPSDNKGTKDISRSHKLEETAPGLLTITGGKWTTYRKMAEETVNLAIKVGQMENRVCVTEDLKIHGYTMDYNVSDFKKYGSDGVKIRKLLQERPNLEARLHKDFALYEVEVVWAVRQEMAMTLEDVLARRLGVLFQDARAALEMAPRVVAIMAEELGRSREWEQGQLDYFAQVAQHYLPEPIVSGEEPTGQIVETGLG